MQKKPNSIKPWRCVILAIDPGKVSGVAIYHSGVLEDSGTDQTPYDDDSGEIRVAESWCWCAYDDADNMNIPLIVVIESHVHHGKWSPKAMAGTAESVGVWKHYIDQLPKLKWKPKILRLPVDTWRTGIYGHCRKKSMLVFDKKTRKRTVDSRDYWKSMAKGFAMGVTGSDVDSDDEAEAILIGRYACHWWKVGEQAGVKVV